MYSPNLINWWSHSLIWLMFIHSSCQLRICHLMWLIISRRPLSFLVSYRPHYAIPWLNFVAFSVKISRTIWHTVMAALKALTSGRVTVLNSVVGSDLGFQRGNVVHRGCDFQIQMKSGRRLNMVKAAETSSYSYVNGSVASFPNGHGNWLFRF